MRMVTKLLVRSLSPGILMLASGCTPAVVETALTSLRDGAVNVADTAVSAFFETHFGVPANADSAEEVGANDLFIHL